MPFSFKKIIVGGLLLLCTSGLGCVAGQSDFYIILPSYLLFFAGYIYIFRTAKEVDLPFYFGLAIFLRLILLFAFPQLSDDIYRFVWDGRLVTHGHNPFTYLPAQIIEEGWANPWLNTALFEKLNSPNYFSIYPPVAQLTFTTAAWVFPNSLFGSAIVMKLFLLAFEAGTIWLLPKLLKLLNLPSKNALLYALNPLVIIEIMGNLHFEGAMVFFLLLGIYYLIKGRDVLSATALALSIASKLLPLLFLMFFIIRLGWARALKYFVIMGLVLLLLFAPLLNGFFIGNFGESLDLYFRNFEFNSSIFNVVKGIGFYFSGYNLISILGPLMAAVTFFGIFSVALMEKGRMLVKEDWPWQSLMYKMLFAICLYLALTPTVHPWYTILPLAISVFTRFRFTVLWSGLITLTYINYSYNPYWENLWIVGLEYSLVYAFALYEFFKTKPLPLKMQ